MTYSELVKKENKEGFLYIILPMLVLVILAIWLDLPILGVASVLLFVVGIFCIAIPTATKLRFEYLREQYNPEGISNVATAWAQGKAESRTQKKFPGRNIPVEFRQLERGFARWLVVKSKEAGI